MTRRADYEDGDGDVGGRETLRLDKWLWYARFLKSRSLATRLCQSRAVRLNRRPISKANTSVKVGDVLTLAVANRVRVVRVLALGERRGPASEAAKLYQDLTPEQPPATKAVPSGAVTRDQGAGRPTKADRRAIDRLKGF